MRNHKIILGAGLIVGSMMLATPVFAQFFSAHEPFFASNLSNSPGKYHSPVRKGYYPGLGLDTRKVYFEGVAALNAGQYRIAMESFKKVLSVAPNHGPTNYLMGLVKADLGKFDQAKLYFRKSIKSDPKYTYAHMALGYVYAVSGDTIKAKQQVLWLESALGAKDGQSGITQDIVEARDRIQSVMDNKKS